MASSGPPTGTLSNASSSSSIGTIPQPPSRMHGNFVAMKGGFKEFGGIVSGNHAKRDAGHAIKELGKAEIHAAKADSAWTKKGERNEEAKAHAHLGKAQYFADRAGVEAVTGGRY
ncbi:hypothetical protein HK097_003595 [Rhizophlyctis rosea]|uniref:Uncharacterized protein n=1 Tax=Rhizophlyctis rosea TaxID=64517 RepID=A0AAD5SFU8_9FUNG|nr:hypothetical protein HK097_003595 [Rhizophlyctis rosea]